MRLSILAAATVPICRIRLCSQVTCTFIDDLADGAGHTFSKQTVFQDEISHDILQRPRFATEIAHLIRGGRTRRVAGQALLASLQELLGPAVVHRGGDPLTSAQLVMLSSSRKLSSITRIFSSDENCRRVARPMSLITASAGFLAGPDVCFIFAPQGLR